MSARGLVGELLASRERSDGAHRDLLTSRLVDLPPVAARRVVDSGKLDALLTMLDQEDTPVRDLLHECA